eukprot:6207009-Pleurochrysis_carterae.AAC.1
MRVGQSLTPPSGTAVGASAAITGDRLRSRRHHARTETVVSVKIQYVTVIYCRLLKFDGDNCKSPIPSSSQSDGPMILTT